MTLDGLEAAVRSRAFGENLAWLVDAMTLRKTAGVPYSAEEWRALPRIHDALEDLDAANGNPSEAT